MECASTTNRDEHQAALAKAHAVTKHPPASPSLNATLVRRLLRKTLEVSIFRGRLLVVGPEGAWFRVGDDPVSSLETRPLLRNLLWSLVRERLEHPGRAVPRRDLARILWPEDARFTRATTNRLNVALTHLRNAGLKAHLAAE